MSVRMSPAERAHRAAELEVNLAATRTMQRQLAMQMWQLLPHLSGGARTEALRILQDAAPGLRQESS